MAAELVCIDAIKLPPLDSDPHTVRPVASRYTDYATRSTVTDIKLIIIIIMFGLGLFYCISNSYTIFDIIPYYRSLNIKLEFKYYLPFRLFISIIQQCLTIPPLPPLLPLSNQAETISCQKSCPLRSLPNYYTIP